MAAIKVNRPCDIVWGIFTDQNSWEIWWGGVLKKVKPGWQPEAILEWKGGDRSIVFDFLPLKRMAVRGNSGEVITWSFTTDGPESTVVLMEGELRVRAKITSQSSRPDLGQVCSIRD